MGVKIEIRRHGECKDYERDVLTSRGKKDSEKLAKRVPDFDIILSGSSGRARETVEILSKGKVKVKISSFLDEILEIDQEEKFNPKTAVRCAREALKFIYNEILEDGLENKKENLSVLAITSGGLLEVLEFLFKHEISESEDEVSSLTEADLSPFKPLEGIQFFRRVEVTDLRRV